MCVFPWHPMCNADDGVQLGTVDKIHAELHGGKSSGACAFPSIHLTTAGPLDSDGNMIHCNGDARTVVDHRMKTDPLSVPEQWPLICSTGRGGGGRGHIFLQDPNP